MHPFPRPPRRVTIGDAASFAGVTPRTIRHYHQIGVLPEPERGPDDRRRYDHEAMTRLLWVRAMADAGIALDDIRDALADAPHGADGGDEVAGILERLERTLDAREAELRRQRTAVQRMRRQGSRMGLLSDVVSGRLEDLPEGALRQADLDTLLVTERTLGPLVAAIQATRFVALATHPELRQESDRVDSAEEALDDTVAVDDPRVEHVAADRHAFEEALHAVIEDSGLAAHDEALLDAWDAEHPDAADGESCGGRASKGVVDAISEMPYDLSPARLRSMELAVELGARESHDS